ncbi:MULTISPECIES: PTS fructose transporter subunit IIC [Thermococcus]|jgi:PTS system fructose-specific IIC component|uniref:PTS fructose transporter subunit IIC n=1 Tax=Thermococcus TaxID=2263 RepID=UPI000B3558F3|nr:MULTISPECIES: fructose-specific PTS transporter subunit EIIC [Thermococcus]MCA6212727.1 PTS transporter subunit EIIC [Thermococcus bergensis]MDK2983473.1 fructose system or component [Thermococcaceae archaeon]
MPDEENRKIKIVATTACPTGIAHTYMAAEALEKAAKELGVEIKVETQGAKGIEGQLSEKDIEEADAVIVAAATKVDLSRFRGKPIVEVPLQEAIKNAKDVLLKAIELAKKESTHRKEQRIESPKKVRESRDVVPVASVSGAYKHLLTGVSFMIPFVVAGGVLIALSFVFGIHAFEKEGTLAWALMKIGGGSAFKLMVPILAGYIAYSIADKPGLAPGMVGGLLAADMGAGFLGGIVAGYIAGYLVNYMKKVKVPDLLSGIYTIFVIPVVSVLVVGLLMVYVIGNPIASVTESLRDWLSTVSTAGAITLGLILGAMMAFDMGGPVNKAAYTFAVGLLGEGIYTPMAAVMAAGMTPPLGLALATTLKKELFTEDEIEAGRAAWILGISFITEGAIPFAAADPFRVIPSIMAGSAITGALSMALHLELRAPHGGIFAIIMPNVVNNPIAYLGVIAIGTVITALVVIAVKKYTRKGVVA